MERWTKMDGTLVTAVAVAVNKHIITELRRISSEVDIVGEEVSDRTTSPWQVVCDPVDGTLPYTWGIHLSTVMIGLLYEGTPVMGVILDPYTGNAIHAQKGEGVWTVNGAEKLPSVSKAAAQADKPVVGSTSWPGCRYPMLQILQHIEESGVTVVVLPSIGIMEMMVATGVFAGTIFPGRKHHDTAPGHVIVEEAGGVVTDIIGNPLRYERDKPIKGHVMANPEIHGLLVDAVRRFVPA